MIPLSQVIIYKIMMEYVTSLKLFWIYNLQIPH